RIVEPSGRVHDQERAVESRAADMGIDLSKVAAHDRPDIGIRDYRRAAFELAIFLRELVGGGDEHSRVILLQDFFRAPLVLAAGGAIEKKDCRGLDSKTPPHATKRGNLVLVERGGDLALAQNALLESAHESALTH